MHFNVIILDQFKPSTLPHIEIRLSENILEALVISIDVAMITKQIMTPYFESMDNSRKL